MKIRLNDIADCYRFFYGISFDTHIHTHTFQAVCGNAQIYFPYWILCWRHIVYTFLYYYQPETRLFTRLSHSCYRNSERSASLNLMVFSERFPEPYASSWMLLASVHTYHNVVQRQPEVNARSGRRRTAVGFQCFARLVAFLFGPEERSGFRQLCKCMRELRRC